MTGFADKVYYNVANAKTLEIYLQDGATLGTGNWAANLLNYKVNKNTKDIYGRYLENAAGVTVGTTVVTKNVDDKIAPAVASFKFDENEANKSATMAAFNLNAKTGNSDLDGAPVIKVTDTAATVGAADPQGNQEVTVVETVTVLYTEPVVANSLSVTTYTFNNGFEVTAVPTVSGNAVEIQIKKVFKSKKAAADIQNDVVDMLNDLMVTQVNSVEDANHNVMSGNNSAMDILDVK